MVLVMYAVWIERYNLGELDDLYPIVFSTKKQAKNYARKVSYPYKVSSVSKVDFEWCSKNKPDCYRIKPRQSTGIVFWEQF